MRGTMGKFIVFIIIGVIRKKVLSWVGGGVARGFEGRVRGFRVMGGNRAFRRGRGRVGMLRILRRTSGGSGGRMHFVM